MSAIDRLKYQFAIYGGTLGIIIIILGLAMGGAAIYTYVNPPTEEIPPKETNVQQFATTTHDSAIVTKSTPLYERGERLRNQPVYFTNSTPRIQLSLTVKTPPNRSVNTTQRLILHHQAVFNEEIFWQEQSILISKQRVIRDGESRINTTLNMTAIKALRSSVTANVGTVGTVSSELRLQVTYESPVDGGTYSGELTATTPIQFSGDAYWFQNNLSSSQTERQLTQSKTRELSPDLRLVGGLAGGSLLLNLLGITLVLWRSREVDIHDLQMDIYHQKYDEWISEGEFPTDADNRYVYINSLEDLVDVGIDTNKRIIYDPNLEVYSVMDGEIVYYHATDPTTVSPWLSFTPED